ncbi:MAG: Ig-like domain-containing protein [Saprospirales bacterium]|nr:Ig-like domain-containing protein [Saprospirales bacterium]
MKQLVFALPLLALFACARPVAPEGGPKDATPPAVVPEKSAPNRTTRFQERQFQLSFDEWVTLQDVGAQVLVSPPLLKRPAVTLKGRTVTFKLDKEEVLRPNTTYTIHFGNAVEDLHEGIPAKDLRFVFSTGDVIDSLSMAGSVVDAFSGDPLENIAVLLYDYPSADSIVRQERPYYLARTDKSGQFAIPNVRAGAFRCVAIDDVNQNLKWDGETERIGFPDSLVQVNDSIRTLPAIRVFRPAPQMRLLTKDANRYGLVRLGFSQSPDSIALQPDQPGIRWLADREQDTLLVWYDRADSMAWNLIAGRDTVPVKAMSRSGFLSGNKPAFGDERTATAGRGRRSTPTTPAPPAVAPPPRVVNVKPGKHVLIPFGTPLTRVDTALVVLAADSVRLHNFQLRPDSSTLRILRLDARWQDGQRYTFLLLPGALTDFFGSSNTDTLRRVFSAPPEKQVGSLNLTLGSLQAGVPYLLRLLKDNTVEEERFFTAETAETRFVFQKLLPLAYTLQLIEDRNGNGRWDTGDYFERRQPERVFLKKLEPLRANWEVEARLDARVSTGRRGD